MKELDKKKKKNSTAKSAAADSRTSQKIQLSADHTKACCCGSRMKSDSRARHSVWAGCLYPCQWQRREWEHMLISTSRGLRLSRVSCTQRVQWSRQFGYVILKSASQGWNIANWELKISTEATIISAPLRTNIALLNWEPIHLCSTSVEYILKMQSFALLKSVRALFLTLLEPDFHYKNTTFYLCFVDDLQFPPEGGHEYRILFSRWIGIHKFSKLF